MKRLEFAAPTRKCTIDQSQFSFGNLGSTACTYCATECAIHHLVHHESLHGFFASNDRAITSSLRESIPGILRRGVASRYLGLKSEGKLFQGSCSDESRLFLPSFPHVGVNQALKQIGRFQQMLLVTKIVTAPATAECFRQFLEDEDRVLSTDPWCVIAVCQPNTMVVFRADQEKEEEEEEGSSSSSFVVFDSHVRDGIGAGYFFFDMENMVQYLLEISSMLFEANFVRLRDPGDDISCPVPCRAYGHGGNVMCWDQEGQSYFGHLKEAETTEEVASAISEMMSQLQFEEVLDRFEWGWEWITENEVGLITFAFTDGEFWVTRTCCQALLIVSV